MSTHNICFCRQIRKIKILFGGKKPPFKSYDKIYDSSQACSKSHPDICSSLIDFIMSNDSVSRQQRPWSDCADAQADLGVRCLHMPDDTFLHGVGHIFLSILTSKSEQTV